ncbi:hypothetical protein AVEN_165107-1 [Araneus ventricosus]|uniref:Uncharacterized protein n=1 Tax=Araneus ventricosus TaxID=182803 RepID=A0A4Y2L047_ARAVE|nr:hypothetical protein AVEN_165107-1 [Araneus ventricosus]
MQIFALPYSSVSLKIARWPTTPCDMRGRGNDIKSNRRKEQQEPPNIHKGADGLEPCSLAVRMGNLRSVLLIAQTDEICILSTALICFRNAFGESIVLRCLTDSESQVCAIPSKCSIWLELGKEKINIPVSELNGTNNAFKRKMDIEISNLEKDSVRCVPFYAIPMYRFNSNLHD